MRAVKRTKLAFVAAVMSVISAHADGDPFAATGDPYTWKQAMDVWMPDLTVDQVSVLLKDYLKDGALAPDDAFAPGPPMGGPIEEIQALKNITSARAALDDIEDPIARLKIAEALNSSEETLVRYLTLRLIDLWDGPFEKLQYMGLETTTEYKLSEFHIGPDQALAMYRKSPWRFSPMTYEQDGESIPLDWDMVNKVTPLEINIRTEFGFKNIPLRSTDPGIAFWDTDMDLEKAYENVKNGRSVNHDQLSSTTGNFPVPEVTSNLSRPAGELVVVSKRLVKSRESAGYVYGGWQAILENNTGRDLEGVQVTLSLRDKDGVELEDENIWDVSIKAGEKKEVTDTTMVPKEVWALLKNYEVTVDWK